MSRKNLFRRCTPEQLSIFLEAESLGILQEVPGGWLLNGGFVERLYRDSISMASLEHDIYCCKEEMKSEAEHEAEEMLRLREEL
jgi:hypothetical protein